MIVTIKNMAKCLLSPRLYNIRRHGSHSLYDPGNAEYYGDTVISIASILLDVSMYLSPFVAVHIYWKGMMYEDLYQFGLKMFGSLTCIFVIALLSRAWGRACNPDYMLFIKALKSPKTEMSRYLEEIGKFDFEFYAWPATYVVPYMPNNALWDINTSILPMQNPYKHLCQEYIVKFLAYIAVKTFALRLIYPGSLSLIHCSIRAQLLQGRAILIEHYSGKRLKIITGYGDSIDAMLVDNRGKADRPNIGGQPSTNQNTLVICCEGNAGFYENGIMMSPLHAGYSVMGWNHPGFAGSTGDPYPRQEHAAIDALLKYATHELHFQTDQIIMYGWSIGGYTATWAASVYNTRGLILDATFDDLLALALKQMPASWDPLVREVVRKHVNLNVAEVLRNYDGKVHLIRRSQDELICLTPGDISTNRGNNLLVKLIKYRHSMDHQFDEELLVRYANMHESSRPLSSYGLDDKSKHMLRLIALYSSDYNRTHCDPLKSTKFVSVMTLFDNVERGC